MTDRTRSKTTPVPARYLFAPPYEKPRPVHMSHGMNSRTIVFTGAKSAATMCEPCGVRTTVAPSNVSCPQKGVSLPRVARSTTVAFGAFVTA